MEDQSCTTYKLGAVGNQLQQILDRLHEGYILVDEDANIHDVNAAYCNMVGYSKKELLSMKLTELRRGMSSKYQKEFIEDTIKKGSKEFETKHRTKDGRMIELNASAAAIEKDGKTYLAGFVRDITQHNEDQRKLEESRRRFKSLFEHNPHSVYYMDLEGNYLGVNSKLQELSGYSKSELLELNFAPLITEKDLERAQKHFREAVQGSIQEYEIVGVTKQGEEKPIRVTNFPMIVGGDILGVFGIAEDITERKEAKQKLLESELKWQELVKNSPQPVQVVNKEADILLINRAGAELYGSESPEELIGESILTFNLPAVQNKIKERVARMLEGEPVEQYHEHVIITKQGEERIVEVYSTSVDYQGGKAVQSVYHDITDRKLAEEKLKESEERWQRLVEENPKPVQVTIDGKIVFINEAGVTLYEAESRDALIGMSVLNFTHPQDLEKVKQRKYKLEKGLPVDQIHENRLTTLMGNEKYIEVHSIPITYKEKQAIQTVIYDVTERQKKESTIQASLEEKEVLLQEIHHRVKNNMAVVSGLLQMQAMSMEEGPAQQILETSQLRIHSMAMVHEKLYASESLSEINFAEYAKELSQVIIQSNRKNHKDIAISYKLDDVKININQAIPCGLILNEWIVNCFKHAFEEQNAGTILVGLTHEEGEIHLFVEDDGCGLPEDFNINNQQTLGMTLIDTLTKQLEGKLTVTEGNRNLGTCFKLSIAD
jgi:PAS domain S-box-containing protein